LRGITATTGQRVVPGDAPRALCAEQVGNDQVGAGLEDVLGISLT